MKSLQELYDEIMASDELKKQFVASQQSGIESFVKANSCDATIDDIKAFLEAKMNEEKELTLDELENVSGGCNDEDVMGSLCTVGFGCLYKFITSLSDGEVGKGDDKTSNICSGCPNWNDSKHYAK